MTSISRASTALLTDQYELTMLRAARQAGTAHRNCVFEVFARSLPGGRRYGVVAGTRRIMDALADFRFDTDEIDYLRVRDVVDASTAAWLANYRFTGDIWGYPEGELFFPGSPVLTISGTFAETVLLETLVLSVLNADSAVATAASRMATAAGSRPCIEMGSRRTHELAAPTAARAAYIGGFSATSNLEAGRQYDIPTMGTSAHSFTLLHASEREAFEVQVAALGSGTTLLVDTFDLLEGVRTAVAVAGTGLGAVRLDSGHLPSAARAVRAELDALGATGTRIVASGDLDEHAIADLVDAPVDAYGIGTSVVTGSGVPTAGLVYKLVARALGDGPDAPLLPVAKTSTGKGTRGGRKLAYRRFDGNVATAEQLQPGLSQAGPPRERPLAVPWLRAGDQRPAEQLAVAQDRRRASLDELPGIARRLAPGDPAIPTVYDGFED